MKYFLTSVVVIGVFLLALGSFYAGRRSLGGTKNSAATSVVLSLTPSPVKESVSPEPTVNTASPTSGTTKVSAGGILTFPKYRLTLPSGWTFSRESENKDIETVSLNKDGYQVRILQGGFGGSVCIFPGDPEPEGPSAKYDKYVDLETKSGDNMRRAWTGDETKTKGYGVCQNTKYGWQAPTLYGSISLIVPLNADKKIVGEMDSIINSLEKIQ